jgi:hypothetical protein
MGCSRRGAISAEQSQTEKANEFSASGVVRHLDPSFRDAAQRRARNP